MPKGNARCATARPMPPIPTSPSVRPWSPPSPPKRAMFQTSGGSWIHTSGSRFSAASITPSTHSAMGMALAPREQVSVRSPSASKGNRLTPVP